MVFVLAKVAFTPLLLAACTYVAHRWGDAVGGWLLGLPITSGPVSVFLFAEHGALFAEKAATATLLGLVAAAVFCASYSVLARDARWWLSLGGAYALCLATAWALSLAHLGLPESIVLALVALTLLAAAMPRGVAASGGSASSVAERGEAVPGIGGAPGETGRHTPTAGLLARMLVAAVSVLAITALAGVLGPRVGGLLAPLPVLAAVMAASSHRRGARRETRGLLSGAVVGAWGGVAFFGVVAFMLGPFGPLEAYGAATAAALLVGAAAMYVHGRPPAATNTWVVADVGWRPTRLA